jgi:hypothetical protein
MADIEALSLPCPTAQLGLQAGSAALVKRGDARGAHPL